MLSRFGLPLSLFSSKGVVGRGWSSVQLIVGSSVMPRLPVAIFKMGLFSRVYRASLDREVSQAR